jgi:hypothetical protein
MLCRWKDRVRIQKPTNQEIKISADPEADARQDQGSEGMPNPRTHSFAS